MSNPSPKKKISASSDSSKAIPTIDSNAPPPPRQIRFVSSDGQPQTKRRRVTAACRTCRKRKIRCSGEQPVCKTCRDCGHKCLGYNDPDKPEKTTLPGTTRNGYSQSMYADEGDEDRSLSHSPTTPLVSLAAPAPNTSKSPQPKTIKLEAPLPLTTDTLNNATKEQDRLAAVTSPESSRTSLSSGHRTHVPYFRYFGPTAIVPGFKQMVVRVRDGRRGNLSQSSDSIRSLKSPRMGATGPSLVTVLAEGESNSIPFYDRDDSLPTSKLVTHLCDLFFVHLGCSFPFLQRNRFMADLKGKKIDSILVDAVCALAARFSPHPLLSPPQARPIDGEDLQPDVKRSDHGQPFAHRAMTAVVNALSCPTLSVVQACLLLAYEEFGSNHDSGLWMYLGIAIRMAQDLGMQKLQGLKHRYGRTGLRPKAIITGQAGKLGVEQSEGSIPTKRKEGGEASGEDSQRAMEREQVDTFWSVFFLDRVISSGTGRPVTLRDEDIELYFPLQSESILLNGWPAPFPPLIRIIHLYGRVTDLINAIQEDNHIDAETLKRLAGMESDLTSIYQRLSPKLHFNTMNFQTYVKAQEGTNFILLHFWFHALIVLLHQPTLLNSFGGQIQHLYPNSRELSMSSAKTIADILSFSELIDAKSFIGNPFTSQPMYIAACAFLMESAYYSSPSSRSGSPSVLVTDQSSAFTVPNMDSSNSSERKTNTKHSLLASAAKENYQRCYRALRTLQTYWEGTKYILTVLDQKAKGIGDPLLYTTEEMESTADIAYAPSLVSPNWQPSLQSVPADTARTESDNQAAAQSEIGSPKIDPSQAIGWALTGEINSAQPNLSLLYHLPVPQLNGGSEGQISVKDGIPTVEIHTANHTYAQSMATYPSAPTNSNILSTPNPKFSGPGNNNIIASNPYSASNTGPSHAMYSSALASSHIPSPYAFSSTTGTSYHHQQQQHQEPYATQQYAPSHISDTLIESQDIDMAAFHNQAEFPFIFSNDFNPYLEYLPPDVINYFGDSTSSSSAPQQQHQSHQFGVAGLLSPEEGEQHQR
ncbi:C6 transcription factor, putative [Talaromyces stipitatus ATCC 10500]|uniref:C6 transcription factor, putative n=1 Tax=Talaromyces stipitatus (strain ATCC 10500 / CBS 375.48 / QM 6759 / NRRL 1006) TaxID=441959 RepID=B8M0G3_TALSN|nr:C6 transcription factor, putative [Talaromyces stipitatus ATCC 10500]EED21260.1 C6 transcription factor, putative [Talaromyces stipitatus ATCC 10500]